MGTTIVLTLLQENQIIFAHCGDSRAYRIRKNQIKQLTEDHSLVDNLVKAGRITKEEARTHEEKNIITQCLGRIIITPEVQRLGIQTGDIFLLCSDGLTDMVEDSEILKIIRES